MKGPPSQKLIRLLYLFVNNQSSIFEIERTQVSKSAPPSERFQWYFLDKIQGKLFPFRFLSMSAHEDQHHRDFQEGQMTFDSEKATFRFSPSQPHHFTLTSGLIHYTRTFRAEDLQFHEQWVLESQEEKFRWEGNN